MIPVFWRYAIGNYLKIFSLSLASIVSMLIVSRFKGIAEFATNGSWSHTALFTLYQIPFIFPIAFPISALLASFILLQKMSRSHETTALRATGFSLRHILAPLLLTAGFLSLLNFSFSAHIAPLCFRESVNIFCPETKENPLLLLRKRDMLKLNHTHLQLEEEDGEVFDLVVVARNGRTHRLELLSAERLHSEKGVIIGKNTAIVAHVGKDYDSLFIENQATISMNGELLSKFFIKRPPKATIRALDFRLLPRAAMQKGKLGKAAWTELLRRSSLSLAVFTFTLLGCAFGFEPGKKGSKTAALTTIFLALLLLSSYFLGKGLRFNPTVSLLSFLFPHCLIGLACLRRLHRISRGRST
jgi:lipopolysaccharide export system permease protein